MQPNGYLSHFICLSPKILLLVFLTIIFVVITYYADDEITSTLSFYKSTNVRRIVSFNNSMKYMLTNLTRFKLIPSWDRSTDDSSGTLPPCLLNVAPNNTAIKVPMEVLSFEELARKYDYLGPGGHHIPKNCRAVNKIAVIIPYRDRASHLRILLNNLHPFLTDQHLDYTVIIVEQAPNQTFNRGKLLNVGFVEAMKLYDWDCVLLHDVDLLPEDKRNLHICPDKNPRHMAVAIDKFNYRLVYDGMFGTSSMLSTTQFHKVNGLSNRFWGWGGEDDDLFTRVIEVGYKVERYNTSVARYKMIKHGREPKSNPINPCRHRLLNFTRRDWKTDGLSSLKYKLLNITFTPLYTHIFVDLLESSEKPEIDRVLCP